MKDVVFIVLFSCFELSISFEQTIQSGFIVDNVTHEAIGSASVTNLFSAHTVLSSESGRFRIGAVGTGVFRLIVKLSKRDHIKV